MFLKIALSAAILAGGFAVPVHAQINVGVVLALTGANSSLGIPYRKGLEIALPKEVNGEKVKLTILDDTSDPAVAVRNAQKLISDDRVDVIIGPANTPAAFAMAPLINAERVPEIALSPVELGAAQSEWVITIPQPGSVWIIPILKDMAKRGVKTTAFIGFNDPWGDLCFNAFKEQAQKYGIQIVAEERFARSDTSVAGQVLRMLSRKPDAIFVGASGTPGALPHLTLAERNWKGPTYASPAVFSKDFLRLGGAAIESVMAVTGPVGAYDQLPESNPIKAVSATFVKSYEAVNGQGSANGFSAYAHDGAVLFKLAAAKALEKSKPGSLEFRQAFRDALRDIKEVVGTQGIYNFKPGSPYGVDERSVVLVRVESGLWKLVQ